MYRRLLTMRIPILPLLIIFVVWLTVKIKMSDRALKQTKESFLENEVNANLTRKQSLDDLDYITIPLNKLPFCSNVSKEILSYQEAVRNLSEKKIVNLTGTSNTDLKLKYGAANLEPLMEYDRNFTELSRALYKWGQALFDNDMQEESKTVLEFAVSCNSDISKIYILLATIYKSNGEEHKINQLISSANELNSLMKNSIIRNLETFLSESAHTDE